MAKILIVDDSAISRKKLKAILETGNHEIIGEAGDGAEALQKYQDLAPELVTMDITMPNMDGISGLKEIIKYDSSARVVMITALGMGETILEALNSGAKNYITKPFAEDQVINSVRDALE